MTATTTGAKAGFGPAEAAFDESAPEPSGAEGARAPFDPFDPVALERRLAEARERRAVALANRKAAPARPVPARPLPLSLAPTDPDRAAAQRPAAHADAKPVLSDRSAGIAPDRPVLRAVRPVPTGPAPSVDAPAGAVAAEEPSRIRILKPFALGLVGSVAAATLIMALPSLRSTPAVKTSARPAITAPAVTEPDAASSREPVPVVPAPDRAGPVVEAAAAPPLAPPAAALPSAAPPFVPGSAASSSPREPEVSASEAPAPEMPVAEPLTITSVAPTEPTPRLDEPSADPAPVAEAAPSAAGLLAAILPLVTPQAEPPEPTSRARIAYFPLPAPHAAPAVIALAQAAFDAGTVTALPRADLQYADLGQVDLVAAHDWPVAGARSTPSVRPAVASARSAARVAARPAESPAPATAPGAAPPPSASSLAQRAVLNAQVEDLLKHRIRDIRRR